MNIYSNNCPDIQEAAAVAVWHQLWELECAFWADVDFNAGLNAASFYSDDGVFDIGVPDGRYVGRSAIAGFYDRRRAQGPRTSAHLVHNFSLLECGERSARTSSYVVLYAAAGASPGPVGTPGMITVSDNRYLQLGDGSWSITQRSNQVLFVSANQPTFAVSDASPQQK